MHQSFYKISPLAKHALPWLLLLLTSMAAQSQNILVGLKGGVNQTQTVVVASHSVVNHLGNVFSEEAGTKIYQPLMENPRSWHAGVSVNLEANQFLGLSFEPAFASWQFAWQTSHTWRSLELVEQQVNLQYRHTNALHFIELPLAARFSLPLGPVIPYVQGGGFFNIMLAGNRNIETTRVEQVNGTARSFSDGGVNYGADDFFNKNFYGVFGGAGLAFDMGYVRMALDVSYRHGLSKVTNGGNRYADAKVADLAFDVMDDLQLRNVQVSLVCHFPVNFGGAPTNGKNRRKTKYVLPYDMRRDKRKP